MPFTQECFIRLYVREFLVSLIVDVKVAFLHFNCSMDGIMALTSYNSFYLRLNIKTENLDITTLLKNESSRPICSANTHRCMGKKQK